MKTNERSTPSQPDEPVVTPQKGRRLGAILGAGLFAGLVAASIGGVASAQTVRVDDLLTPVVAAQTDGEPDTEEPVEEQSEPAAEMDEPGIVVHGGDLSEDDQALFDQFDQCLSDAGIDFEASGLFDESEPIEVEVEWTNIDEESIDAAFEACEPVLDALSDGFFGHAEMLLDHDQFDQCLADAAFESCEDLLGDLPSAAFTFIHECPESD